MAGKKFRFSLDHVLAVRSHAARQAEQALAAALHDRRDHEARLAQAEATLPALAERAPAPGTAAPADFRRFAATQQEAFRARARARRALEAAHHREAEARTALTEARRPEEALHTLREQEADAHRRAAQSAELAFLDDQAAAAYCRQLRTDG